MKNLPASNTSPLIDENTLTLLGQLPLFNGLPRGELKYLAYTLNRLTLEAGTVVFQENEIGDSFYIVIDGRLEVIMGLNTADEKLLATYGAGHYFGEMSMLIPGGQRSASVRTCEKSHLWVMTREDFDELLHRQPHVAYAMAKVMSDRLRTSDNAAFADLREKNHQLQAAYDELKAAQAQIIEKEKLEKELQLAAEIQMSILPRQLPALAEVDFGGHMDPARSVGGDFYDVIHLPDGRLGLFIADVADKGIPAALFMALTRTLVRAAVLQTDSPALALAQVNDLLYPDCEQGMFVTAFYGALDPQTGRFSYANAGHNPPLWLRTQAVSGEVVTAELLTRTGMALGVIEHAQMADRFIDLAPGDRLFFYTDGVTEAFAASGEAFGEDRLQEVLLNSQAQTAHALLDELDQAVTTFVAEHPVSDDITLIVLKKEA